VLHLDRITKDYPGADGPVRVLDGVTLSLSPGGRLAIMGPSISSQRIRCLK
jgi:ABC-type lipoprotein export system ATPase subunit